MRTGQSRLRIQIEERTSQPRDLVQAREGTCQIDQLLSSQHQKARDISPSGATTIIKAIRTISITWYLGAMNTMHRVILSLSTSAIQTDSL
jgi:hypothetical protein